MSLGGEIDSGIHDVLAFVITASLVGLGLFALLRLLQVGRPELSVGRPVAAAVAVRVIGSIGITLTGFATTLRGGDEASFLFGAGELQSSSFLSGEWITSLTTELHEFVAGTQISLFDSPSTSLRLAMSGIAVAGMMLLAVSAYDLAGPRAGALSMWLLAFEPSSIFFTGIVNKESLMLFASGLVVFGSTRLWQKGRADAVILIAIGCGIALATRVYAGGFLIAAAALVVGHAAIQRRGGALASIALASILAMVAFIAVPVAIEESDKESLQTTLQVSQIVNANDDSNLALEEVDFSSRGAIVTNLPIRVRDLLLRPYPWQVSNTSQQLGLLGTLAALGLLFALIRESTLSRGTLLSHGAPILYPLITLLIAYSVAVGNAGTGFRYRMHLIALGLTLAVVWRETRLAAEPAAVATPKGFEAGRLAAT